MSENTPFPDEYIVVDIETTVRNRGENAIGTMQASPYHPDNEIVLYGQYSSKDTKPLIFPIGTEWGFNNNTTYIFHNAKFDLLWLLRKGLPIDQFLYIHIWDTMVVEYLLSGQQKMYSTLNELAVKYGGEPKNERIAEYWKLGLDTTDIPEDELREYLEDDLENTKIVFLAQLERAKKLDMIEFIWNQMEAIKTTTLMEHNGMYIDTEVFSHNMIETHKKLTDVEQWLIGSMAASGIVEPNPASHHHIALMLYGGTQSYIGTEIVKDEEDNPIKYKTGKKAGMVKTRKRKMERPISGFPSLSSFSGSTDDGALKKLKSVDLSPAGYLIDNFIDRVLQYRELAKDFNTYYVGVGKLIWHDSCIHGSISHCGTVTGRLASSKPNLQNISNKED